MDECIVTMLAIKLLKASCPGRGVVEVVDVVVTGGAVVPVVVGVVFKVGGKVPLSPKLAKSNQFKTSISFSA